MGKATAPRSVTGAASAAAAAKGEGDNHTAGLRRFSLWPAIWTLNVIVAILIVVLDWLTPAGVVVGILLCIPIVVTSASDSRVVVWITFLVALVGFLLAAAFGRGPLSPAAVWQPNRIFAFLTLPASLVVALFLQRRRKEVELARDDALAASTMSELMTSLVAHDLRAPLAMAIETMDYVRESAASAHLDSALLGDVQARLRRNLGAIDALLNLVRRDADPGAPQAPALRPIRLAGELQAEVLAFVDEAAMKDQQLQVDVSALNDDVRVIDALALRHAIAIVVDNAIRHGAAGAIRVRATLERDSLDVLISSAKPATHVSPAGGSGMGLQLCSAMVQRAGGRLHRTDEADRVEVSLRLPAIRASGRDDHRADHP